MKERYNEYSYTSNKKNAKLLERFKKIEENPHHDWRLIAWNLSLDYKKQDAKIKKLEKEKKEIEKEYKDDREELFNRIASLYEYIEDGEYIDTQYILEELANMQNYCN